MAMPMEPPADRVVAVADRVGQGLAQCHGRVNWIVASLKHARNDSPRNGKMVAQELIGAREKDEGVAVELPIVDELRLIRTAKPRQAHSTLRIAGDEAVGPGEQDHCCATNGIAVPQQPESTKHLPRIPGSRFIESASAHRFVQGARDLSGIEIIDRPTVCRLGFPALSGVVGLEQRLVVLLPGKRDRGVADPLEGDSLVGVGAPVAAPHRHRDCLVAGISHRDAIDFGRSHRVNASELPGDLLNGLVGDDLSDDHTGGVYAVKHATAPGIQHATERLGSLAKTPGACSGLELLGLGLALKDPVS